MSAEGRPRFERVIALEVANQLCQALQGACSRVQAAGSLRRGKPTVGDIEILYIGNRIRHQVSDDLFVSFMANLADETIEAMERGGVLERRKNVKGSETYGLKNKLMRHRATGLPVDLFSATEANWFNYLVCRTGPMESNIRIATAARARGWKWNPYGAGFSRGSEVAAMHSEEEVFAFVGLPYQEPEKRI